MGSVLHVSLFTDHPRIETVQGAQGILGTQNTDVDCPLSERHATEASGSKHLTQWTGIPLFWHLAIWIVFSGAATGTFQGLPASRCISLRGFTDQSGEGSGFVPPHQAVFFLG